MTLTIKLDGNWSSFQLANSAPPLSVTDSALAPSARIAALNPFDVPSLQEIWAGTACKQFDIAPHSKIAGKTAIKFAYHRCNSYILYCCSLRWMQRQIFKHFSCFYPLFFLSRDCTTVWKWNKHFNSCVIGWQSLASRLPLKKFCYGWLHRRLLRRYRPQSAVNCSTLWERAAGSPPNTSQVSLQIMLHIANQTSYYF